MEARTWTTIDKTGWGDGPWNDEPDKEQWTDETTGYACLLKRNKLGALCGYVGIPPGHPWYQISYDDVRVGQDSPDVHGGLTYSDQCQEGPVGETICHVPGPGEPEPLWWLGFDCAHAFDLSPGMRAHERELGLSYYHHIYRDIGYVKTECASLAAQAKSVE